MKVIVYLSMYSIKLNIYLKFSSCLHLVLKLLKKKWWNKNIDNNKKNKFKASGFWINSVYFLKMLKNCVVVTYIELEIIKRNTNVKKAYSSQVKGLQSNQKMSLLAYWKRLVYEL